MHAHKNSKFAQICSSTYKRYRFSYYLTFTENRTDIRLIGSRCIQSFHIDHVTSEKTEYQEVKYNSLSVTDCPRLVSVSVTIHISGDVTLHHFPFWYKHICSFTVSFKSSLQILHFWTTRTGNLSKCVFFIQMLEDKKRQPVLDPCHMS